jgi:hypothetical protein
MTAVTPSELAFANPVESLAINPIRSTCDLTGNYPSNNIRINVRESE